MRLSYRVRLVLVAPALVLIALVFIAPMVNILATSLHVNTESGTSSTYTAGNYDRAISGYFLSSLFHSLWISGVVTLVAVVAAFPIARVYSRVRGLRRFGLTLALFLPLLTTSVVTSYGWLIILGKTGIVNRSLESLHLVDQPIRFLYTPLGDIIALEEWILPFVILPIAGSLLAIDPALERASASLGAGRLRTFTRVTLPLAKGGVAGGAAVAYALSMSSYTTPQLVGGGVVQVVPIVIYNEFMKILNMPMGSALAVVLLVVVMVPVALFARRNLLSGT